MQKIDTWRQRLRPIAAVTAALAVTALVGCNRPADDRTAGQKPDAPVTKAERQPKEAAPDARSDAANADQSTKRAANEVSDKVKDAAITTAVNAKLAQDKALSAMNIDVDTVNGRVALRGTAPDAASRERATTLARAVDGVVSVDNQLVVSAKG